MTGDLLVFDRIGAYSVTEGIYLFLSRKLPVVLTCTQEHGLSLVRDALPTDILNDALPWRYINHRAILKNALTHKRRTIKWMNY